MPGGRSSHKVEKTVFDDSVFTLRRVAGPLENPHYFEPDREGLVQIVGLLKVREGLNGLIPQLTVIVYFDDHHDVYVKWYDRGDTDTVRADLGRLPSICTYETFTSRGFIYNG